MQIDRFDWAVAAGLVRAGRRKSMYSIDLELGGAVGTELALYRARAFMDEVSRQPIGLAKPTHQALIRPGGSHMLNRKGFTLIELLIVVVIIGILAAIAIPKFANTKEKAYVASMKSDLRNLITAEEGYFADNTTYTTDKTAVGASESAGVTVTITAATGTGWAATASHTATSTTCAIAGGDGTNAIDATAAEGEPKCA